MTKPIILAVAVAMCSGTEQAIGILIQHHDTSAAGRLSGRVLDHDTHQPLPGVRIEMQSDNADRDGTVTDDNGAFLFDHLENGRYWLAAHRVDYAPAYVGQESIPGKPVDQVMVHGGQPTDVGDIELMRGGVIAGHVRDPYGRPAASATVTLQRLTRENREGPRWSFEGRYGSADVESDSSTGSTTTNALGEFRVYDLPAGHYVISARGIWPSVVFFPATTEPAAAQPIAVAGGKEVADIDVRLHAGKGYGISGDVRSPIATDGSAVELRPRHEYLRPWTHPVVRASNGHFHFSDVPPGSYWIVGHSYRQIEPDLWGIAILNVIDRDVSGVDIAVQPSVAISGRVVLDGFDKPADRHHRFTVTLELQECRSLPWSNEDDNSTSLDDDATFEINELMPGRYRLRVRAGDDGPAFEIVSVSIRGQRLSAEDFDVPRGDLSDLVIRVKRR